MYGSQFDWLCVEPNIAIIAVRLLHDSKGHCGGPGQLDEEHPHRYVEDDVGANDTLARGHFVTALLTS
ncbi:MAG: hypothetical protein HUU46_14875 [Candidatus Hydrogenedentes bacterium]|nr:hypothetical protein [Candidatus Hydrogenedentota bacterium]